MNVHAVRAKILSTSAFPESGVVIQIKIVHASPREYIMQLGTAIGAEGYLGWHPAEFSDTVVDGETWYQPEGKREHEIYRTGDRTEGGGW